MVGRGRRRTVISAGALVLALGVPSGPVAAAVRPHDCDHVGGGGLGGLAEGLCELVDGLTGPLEPVTDRIRRTDEPVHDDNDGALQDAPGEPAPPSTSTGPAPDVLPETFRPDCLPLIAAPDCGAETSPPPETEPAPEPSPEPEPSPGQTEETAREKRQAEVVARPPVEPPAPPDHRPLLKAEPKPAHVEPVDPEAPRVQLLWPYLDRMPTQMRGQKAILKPGRPSDALGTALTAALLLSAILAARIAYARRAGDEHGESMPFEPLRMRGRHRLASH
jgi:hypothetical protein